MLEEGIDWTEAGRSGGGELLLNAQKPERQNKECKQGTSL